MPDAVSPITIDAQRCNGCGACLPICHEHAMAVRAGKVVIDYELCSTCSQCVALCPERALSWCGTQPSARAPDRLPSVAQLDELMKERRSTRYFTRDKIPREQLAAIAGYAAYAPTNNYGFRLVIADDAETLRNLEAYARSMAWGLYRLVFKHRLLHAVLSRLPFLVHAGPMERVKIEGNLRGRHAIFHDPAAMLFLVGDSRVALSSDSAQYALANIVFAAQARGIASCLSGAAKRMLAHHANARRILGLGSQERVYGALTLGYPAVEFKNNVEGKSLSITWLSESGPAPLRRPSGSFARLHAGLIARLSQMVAVGRSGM